MKRARRLVQKALALDSENSQAQRALGRILYMYDWDWKGGETALRRAVHLNPSDVRAQFSLGLFLVYKGGFDEGVEHCEKAQRLDPLSLVPNIWLGMAYHWAGRWDDGFAQMQFVSELHPGWAEVHHCVASIYAA